MAMLKRPGGAAASCCPRLPLRRWSNGRGEETTTQSVQPAHHRSAAGRCVRPYASIPTNLLFFERVRQTPRSVYQGNLVLRAAAAGKPQDVHQDKAAPVRGFADCIAWWDKREENSQAWRVPVEQVVINGYNLDLKNPSVKQDLEHVPPRELVDRILEKERRMVGIMVEIRQLLSGNNYDH